jgi:hypothetical protein
LNQQRNSEDMIQKISSVVMIFRWPELYILAFCRIYRKSANIVHRKIVHISSTFFFGDLLIWTKWSFLTCRIVQEPSTIWCYLAGKLFKVKDPSLNTSLNC